MSENQGAYDREMKYDSFFIIIIRTIRTYIDIDNILSENFEIMIRLIGDDDDDDNPISVIQRESPFLFLARWEKMSLSERDNLDMVYHKRFDELYGRMIVELFPTLTLPQYIRRCKLLCGLVTQDAAFYLPSSEVEIFWMIPTIITQIFDFRDISLDIKCLLVELYKKAYIDSYNSNVGDKPSIECAFLKEWIDCMMQHPYASNTQIQYLFVTLDPSACKDRNCYALTSMFFTYDGRCVVCCCCQ